MPNTLFICPNGHEPCKINPSGFQWFDLSKDDPNYILNETLKAEKKINMFLGEIRKIPYFLGYVLGMICFIISFSTIFNNFAKGQSQNEQLFGVFMFVWLLYGFAYLMSYKTKNIAYNLLDLVSKNIFGLYLLYVIQQEKSIN